MGTDVLPARPRRVGERPGHDAPREGRSSVAAQVMNRSWVSAPICTSATWVNPAASNSRIPAAWRPASGPHGICALTSYQVNVLAGVMLTAFGLGIAFPTVSITVTAGIPARQQGVAGGLFVTAQQAGAAAGLAALATVADARTHAAHGSLIAGYRLSFLVAVGLIAAAAAIVLIQLRRTAAGPAGTAAASGVAPPHHATAGATM